MMMALDMTAQLAPILWAVEGLMLFATAWLLGSHFWQEVHRGRQCGIARLVDPSDRERDPTSNKLAA